MSRRSFPAKFPEQTGRALTSGKLAAARGSDGCCVMGIRFFCPNGHKLNVKAFQAGRRGVCPYCGEKTQIPTESTRPSSREARSSGNAEAESPTPDKLPSTPGPSALGIPMAELASAGSVSSPGADRSGAEAAAMESPVEAPTVEATSERSPQPPVSSKVASTGYPSTAEAADPVAAAAPRPSLPDPLVEAPNAVWYVRPPAGGQFGPATSEVMRSWLEDGRVTNDSLVWREGWRDWEGASSVFPQLAVEGLPTINQTTTGGGGTPASAGQPDISASLSSDPSSSPAALAYRSASRRRSNATTAVVITALVLAVIVLLAVLAWVLIGQNGDSATTERETAVAPARFASALERSAEVA